VTRTDLPTAFDQRTQLVCFLDYVHATVHEKCAGITEADARRPLLPGSPLMTVSGLVNHLRWMEYHWIEVILLGGEDHAPWTDEDPDREMRIAVEQPIAALLAEYEQQCARYRDLVAGMDLSATAVRPMRDGTHVTVSWILLHLIEEIARHNGHLDILREQLDGVTGS
jgi:uncharacterized damage-inducible protein DinB